MIPFVSSKSFWRLIATLPVGIAISASLSAAMSISTPTRSWTVYRDGNINSVWTTETVNGCWSLVHMFAYPFPGPIDEQWQSGGLVDRAVDSVQYYEVTSRVPAPNFVLIDDDRGGWPFRWYGWVTGPHGTWGTSPVLSVGSDFCIVKWSDHLLLGIRPLRAGVSGAVFGAMLGATIAAIRTGQRRRGRRRTKAGLCWHCGYPSATGFTRCPECGSELSIVAAAPR